MEVWDDQKMLALCLIDLAQGYQRRLGTLTDLNFILNCCKTALKYYPNYINALVLQAETKTQQFETLISNSEAKSSRSHLLFSKLTKLYTHIRNFGYRAIPKAMYLKWLVSLKE